MKYFFYILNCLLFACATLVIGVHNPIHSILLLIAVFALGSILLISLNIEFFAIVFLIVYVGAIVVLFLFIIMMLDIKIANTAQKIKDFFSYRNIIIGLILMELLVFINEDFLHLHLYVNLGDETAYTHNYIDYSKLLKYTSHIQVIGKSLFTDHIISFLIAGFLLFIAMIGAIVVTLNETIFKTVKQQNPHSQAMKTAENAIFNFRVYKKSFNK
jgi:NADH-quinone oxidoreductase subunit J